jgi:diguanylate cyclase (GGDEF)-like protein
MIDIDHFKQINDAYGHQVGDQVLVAFAQTLTKAIRSTDFVYRIGGEEFIILLPHTPLKNAMIFAEKLCDVIARSEHVNAEISITASIGVAMFTKDDDVKHDSLIKRADDNLYLAKTEGRNRVVG